MIERKHKWINATEFMHRCTVCKKFDVINVKAENESKPRKNIEEEEKRIHSRTDCAGNDDGYRNMGKSKWDKQ